ncbi:MAG: dihydrolipoamide acetyltransferase family protein [Candidatus Tectomicrobia bacterium]|nr:dihydrolipoamide acetyltransferase family protein [Candidatus Tectomicrobia bacterium]
MALEFRFPDVGEGIAQGEIVRWLVAQGDEVRADQPLVEVETDKAVVEIPAPRDGTILRLPLAAGETILVGEVLAVIGDAGDAAEEPQTPPEAASVVGRLDAKTLELPPEPTVAEPGSRAAGNGRVLAIPSVRKLARDLGVDLSRITPSGPRGRVRREDVLREAPQGLESLRRAAADRDAHGPVQLQPLTALRRTIAKAMVEAATTAVPVTTTDEVDISELLDWRTRADAAAAEVRLTLLPFIMKAVVAALRQHPELNASLADDQQHLVIKRYYHLGIATDTPEGLIVPVLKDVDRKSLLTLATELQSLADLAKTRRIPLADLRGGTFTITNYGAVGGIFATPVLHLPQVAILGVGRFLRKPAAHEGTIALRTILPLSLTFDHRVLDGAAAQRFLNSVMASLADPARLLVAL